MKRLGLVEHKPVYHITVTVDIREEYTAVGETHQLTAVTTEQVRGVRLVNTNNLPIAVLYIPLPTDDQPSQEVHGGARSDEWSDWDDDNPQSARRRRVMAQAKEGEGRVVQIPFNDWNAVQRFLTALQTSTPIEWEGQQYVVIEADASSNSDVCTFTLLSREGHAHP